MSFVRRFVSFRFVLSAHLTLSLKNHFVKDELFVIAPEVLRKFLLLFAFRLELCCVM